MSEERTEEFSGSRRPACGEGVFAVTQTGGLEPRRSWQRAIDALCVAVARVVGPGAYLRIEMEPCRRCGSRDSEANAGRTAHVASLDVCGGLGDVWLNITVGACGDPRRPDARELPTLYATGMTAANPGIASGSRLDFWMATESDVLCLAARLLAALGQNAWPADAACGRPQ